MCQNSLNSLAMGTEVDQGVFKSVSEEKYIFSGKLMQLTKAVVTKQETPQWSFLRPRNSQKNAADCEN